jgi:hypothetical protein
MLASVPKIKNGASANDHTTQLKPRAVLGQ